MSSKDLDLIKRLVAAENLQKTQDFIAPFSGNGRVKLRMCGVAQEYPIFFPKNTKTREGFGIFRIMENGRAKVAMLTGMAPLKLIRDYCNLLPKARFIFLDEVEGSWYGVQISQGTRKLQTDSAVVLRMPGNANHFSSVIAAFDGINFWCCSADVSRPKIVAATLRNELLAMTSPEDLRIPGLLTVERKAYEACWKARKPKSAYDPNSTLTEKERIELALSQAGAKLQSVTVSSTNNATVRFDRGGVTHSVTIDRKSLQVISSGICLSGKDKDFDLTSLVGVFNEKENQGDRDWDDD